VNIQKSPDGGVSKFWYDRLGRLALSQNAKQRGWGNFYSYTFYDFIGRITEVGQIKADSVMTDFRSKNDANLQSWFTANASKRGQITQTGYDLPFGAPTFPNGILYNQVLNQQNLRNRVSYSQIIDTATDTYPKSATYYSYDVHGNVDTLVQDFGSENGPYNVMTASDNEFKKIAYNFDLISGKVNQVSYQAGKRDAYYQRYVYDAENRLTDVISGRDSIMLSLFREQEAHYSYFAHGPLARTDLGHLMVQGLDYAYTLQGWMKGINPVMGGTLSNGMDTTESMPVSQDVYGFSLHYYSKDYRAIGYSGSSTGILGSLSGSAAPLYNGNIVAMAVNIPKLGSPQVNNYHYDQLNRIVAMDAYQGLNVQTGTFTPVSLSAYQERISYDPNGNILTYNRHGDAARISMDSLTYTYKDSSNQLDQVVDAAADAAPADYNKYNDIKRGQLAGNYKYDAIGNLVADNSENITNICWNIYGKISSLTKGGQIIRYVYDASGNRIMKQTVADTTIYVRDASGNVLSVYFKPASGTLVQSEMDIYGSSRLGMATQHIAPDTAKSLGPDFDSARQIIFTRGEKLFELSNHLGNVLATVDDRRIQADPNSDGNVDSYAAHITIASDYYPFGMIMPARYSATNSSYRYGFNGKENDSEVKGTGNQQDYGMRIYDPRTGRFLSVDPLTRKYPWFTPYQFASNSPISSIDFDGLEGLVATGIDGHGMIISPEQARVINQNITIALFKATFSEELPKKFIEHYAHGNGKEYVLNKTEVVAVKSAPTGIRGIVEADHDKFDRLMAGAKKGSVINLPNGYAIQAGATTAGTLGRFQIQLSGQIVVDKNDDSKWTFKGAMKFTDDYDFKTSPVTSKDLQRTDWGDIQTKVGGKYLPGQGFHVTSEAVPVQQSSTDESFDWYKGKAADGKQNEISNDMKSHPQEAKEAIKKAKSSE